MLVYAIDKYKKQCSLIHMNSNIANYIAILTGSLINPGGALPEPVLPSVDMWYELKLSRPRANSAGSFPLPSRASAADS